MTTVDDKKYKVIGTTPIRHDGADKVTGRAIYGIDYHMTGMLWGKILRSPHAHARIKSIDASKALALPGVYAVVTGKDMALATDLEVEAGETSLIAFIPALTNAIADAIGIRPLDLPVTPDKLMELMEKHDSD